MNGYQVDSNNLNELSRVGNANQRIGEVQPQATITTIPLTIIVTAQVCVPVSVIYQTFKSGCWDR